MVPAAEVLICSLPAVVLFTRSANWLKLSMNVLDAGQLACMVNVLDPAGCCACAGVPYKLPASSIAPTTAIGFDMCSSSPAHDIPRPRGIVDVRHLRRSHGRARGHSQSVGAPTRV